MSTANAVYVAHVMQLFNPFAFLFYCFLLAAAIFNTINITLPSHDRSLPVKKSHFYDILLLNVTTCFNWIGFFYALKYLEPAIVSAIISGSSPLITLFLNRVLRHNRQISTRESISGAGILSGTLFLAWTSTTGKSGISGTPIYLTILGLAAAVAGGTSISATTIFSKRLNDSGWTARKIMAHRFYLLIPLVGILAFIDSALDITIFNQLFSISIVTVFGVILPLFILQIGINNCEPFPVMALLGISPMCTFILQSFDARITWSLNSALGVLIIIVFTMLAIFSSTTQKG